MSHGLLDQQCINCAIFVNGNPIHKNIGITAEDIGSDGFNIEVLEAVSCIYGFSARDLAIAHLNLNSEIDENNVERKELSEVTSYILQKGLPFCSKCVLSFKQVIINHLKLTNESSDLSLLSKALKERRNFKMQHGVNLGLESGSHYENVESGQSTFKSVNSRNNEEMCDVQDKQAELEFPDQDSPQDCEPSYYEFEDFDAQSDVEDIKVDPTTCNQNKDHLSPNIDKLLMEMKPCSIILHRINSGIGATNRRGVRPRKKLKAAYSTKKKREGELSDHHNSVARRKSHSLSGISGKEEKTSTSCRNRNRNQTGEKCNIKRRKSEPIEDLLEDEQDEFITQRSKDKTYHCQHCDRYFKELFHFYAHQRMDHNCNKNKTNKPEKCDLQGNSNLTKESFFKCGCGYLAYNFECLATHESVCKSQIPVMCEICGKMFKKSHEIYPHKKTVHSEIHPLLPKCKLCGANFVWARNLRNHMEGVHSMGRKDFTCHQCGNSFTTSKNLRRHRKYAHTDAIVDKELFRCKECGILLKHSNSLTRHMRIVHSGNAKLATCPECGKTTKSKSMRGHMKTHDPNRILKRKKTAVVKKTA